MTVTIRRASDRFPERAPRRMTHHGFSFGAHYDPEWLRFGPMVCHDDHVLGGGNGFDEHPHDGLEIITWVMDGVLRHEDSDGNRAELRAGECGRLSAGSGVRHAEHATEDGPARFVQVWLNADDPDRPPHYATAPAISAGPGDGLVPVAGPETSLSVGVAGARFSIARLGVGEQLTVPAAALSHFYLASGALLRFSLAQPLQSGDAVCATDQASYDITAAVPTEVLLWTFDSE